MARRTQRLQIFVTVASAIGQGDDVVDLIRQRYQSGGATSCAQRLTSQLT